MILQISSFIVALLTMLGVLLLARRKHIAWSILLITNISWITIGILQPNWGIVFQNFVFIFINLYGRRKWRKEEVGCENCRYFNSVVTLCTSMNTSAALGKESCPGFKLKFRKMWW